MSPQAAVRAQARLALKNKYVKAIAAFVIGLLPTYIIEGAVTVAACSINILITDNDALSTALYLMISVPLELLIAFFLSPLFNGYVRLFYRNALYSEMDMNDLFYFFEKGRYTRALKLNLGFVLRMLLPVILFFLPVGIYAGVCSGMDNGFVDTVLYKDFYFILSVMSMIATVLYSLRYFTVFTLFAENYGMSNIDIFKTSKMIMSRSTGAAAKLIFSYTPWMLLSLTVLPTLYTGPYMTQGLTIGAKWMTITAYERQPG